MWPHAAVDVALYCCICVLMLLYVCPHADVHLSSYCCICVLILLHLFPVLGNRWIRLFDALTYADVY